MHFGIASGFLFYKAGRKASKGSPVIKAAILKSFLFSLLLFIGIAALLMLLVSSLLLAPIELWVTQFLPNWADWLVRGIVLFIAFIAMLVAIFFSLRFTSVLLGMWYERAVVPIVASHRPDSVAGHGGPSLFVEILREAFYLVVVLVLQFIPAIGWLLSLAFSLWLVGKGVVAPHRAVLKDRNLKRKAPGIIECISAGSAELIFLAIPIIGWFLLPWVMIHMVVGQAALFEEQHAASDPAAAATPAVAEPGVG